MSIRVTFLRRALAAVLWVVLAAGAVGQQPRVQLPGGADWNWTPPAPGMTPVNPPGGANVTLGDPFDPFASGSQPPPSVVGPSAVPGAAPGGGDPLLNNSNPFPADNPSSLFPGGLQTPQLGLSGPSMRFLQAPRLRYTWLGGDQGRDLQMHDFDTSLVFAFPNFLFTNQPVYVVPSFSLHLWHGPTRLAPGQMTDLPGNAYSAFLDSGWETAPQAAIGGEVGVRVGVFSDFSTLTTESLRIQGKGLIRLRATPTVQLRGGVLYVDRLRIKLLPAGGILWTPNPQTRFDIYFPQPKFASYLTTYGNTEVWWYIAAEYGGGSWTIKRAVNGLTEQMDINDIRLMAGLEWGASRFFTRGRRVGFFEAGWVTDREILYRDRPQDNDKLRDTFMIRTGLAY